MSTPLLVVAGEISGDMHAAGLLRALRPLWPGLDVFGIGGEALREQGADLLYDVNDMAVFGLPEALRRLPFFRRAFRDLLREVDKRKPSVALLVDYGGFNLRLARELKRRGIRVIYFISPQVWASRPGRIPVMAEVIDRLLVIFPFEPEVFAGTRLKVNYVGHPLVDEAEAVLAAPAADLSWQGAPRIALLPGSRRQEIDRILPVLWQAAARIEGLHPAVSFRIAAPNAETARHIEAKLAQGTLGPTNWAVQTAQTRQILRQADAAFVASGTATVEAALLRCPMVVTYRTSPFMYLLGKRLVRVPYIGMVNLIAGRELCPERIQDQATPQSLAAAMLPLLGDTEERHRTIDGLASIAEKLGPPGAYARAAERVAHDIETAVRPAGS